MQRISSVAARRDALKIQSPKRRDALKSRPLGAGSACPAHDQQTTPRSRRFIVRRSSFIVHSSFLILLLLALFSLPAFAQFYWPDGGKSVRQGLHLGWNGAMIASGSDEVTLFYYDCRRDGTRDVWGNRLTSTGNRRWGLDGELVTENISEQRYPVLATYSDGSVLVVWEDYAPGRYRDLFAQRYDEQGNAMWSPSQGVTVVEYIRDQFEPRVALDENGYAYIAFTDDRETTGANVRLGAFGQVLSPNGERIGPLGGVQLVDRLWGENLPFSIVGHNSAAYILLTGHNGGNVEIMLQKFLPTAEIAWPDDPAIIITRDGPEPTMIKTSAGLAIGWRDRRDDLDGDAYLAVFDYNRNLISGWPEQGMLIQHGEGVQAVAALSETANGNIVAAVGGYDYDADGSTLSIHRYSTSGTMIHSPVDFGIAALGSSPVDLAPDGENLLVAWTEQFEVNSHTARTQLLTPTGEKLWGTTGNPLWTAEHKELRCDLVKPANGPARLAVVTGRSVARPESLWVGTLNSQGTFATTPDLFGGGITYDIYDPHVVQIADERAMYVWTDGRYRASRDLYMQIVDGQGNPQLEQEGQAITHGERNLQSPPALLADGSGGAYIGWIGDSLGITNFLHIQRFDGQGQAQWSEPVRIISQNGFHGTMHLIAAEDGGLLVAYSRYNEGFVSRMMVTSILPNGQFAWTPHSTEFDGLAFNDMTIIHAVSDGAGGLFATLEIGPWSDTNIGLYHLNRDGLPGEGWSLSGRVVGQAGVRDMMPTLLTFNQGAILCYLTLNDDLATGRLKGYYFARNGQSLWSDHAEELLGSPLWMQDPQLVNDGQGGFLLAWEDYRTQDTARAYIQRFDPNGAQLWTAQGVPASSQPIDQREISLVADGNGGAWLAWEQVSAVDEYPEYDLYCTHLTAQGQPANLNGFQWPASAYPLCQVPTHQRDVTLIPWVNHSALAIWNDSRSSNPGRCCGAGAVGDIFTNVYGQVLSEVSLAAPNEQPNVPQSFAINSIYPNPFNPETKIAFSLSSTTQARLSVLNILGQEIAVLADGKLDAGDHQITWNAADNPSGIYFAKLQSSNRSDVRKLVLLK